MQRLLPNSHVSANLQCARVQHVVTQVLDAADGARATEWEGQHQSALHTSALLFDIDFDGIQDILIATYDGDVLAFKDTVRLKCTFSC